MIRRGRAIASSVDAGHPTDPPRDSFGARLWHFRAGARHLYKRLHPFQLEALNLLAAGQEGVAQHFARGVPPIALWHGIAIRPQAGPPQIENALGWLECRTIAEHAAGDHTFFVAEVETAERGPAEQPLVYVD